MGWGGVWFSIGMPFLETPGTKFRVHWEGERACSLMFAAWPKMESSSVCFLLHGQFSLGCLVALAALGSPWKPGGVCGINLYGSKAMVRSPYYTCESQCPCGREPPWTLPTFQMG